LKTAIGGDDFAKFLRLLALGLGIATIAHLASTKQLQTWHAVGITIGVLGGLADL
jgi:hypothetical protein